MVECGLPLLVKEPQQALQTLLDPGQEARGVLVPHEPVTHCVITSRGPQPISLFLLPWWGKSAYEARRGGNILYLCILVQIKKNYNYLDDFFKKCTEPPFPLKIMSTQI